MSSTDPTGPIILFDGVCNLCSRLVRMVVKRDPKGIFRFASLQSDAGQALLARHGILAEGLQTIVLIDAGRVETKSAAVLDIVSRLQGPWPALKILRYLPRQLLDAVYDVIARHRYRIFGRDDRCLLPAAGMEDRILPGQGD